jgi:uncharacterized membrane protein
VIKATNPPKITDKRLVFVPTAYAVVLVGVAVLQLVFFEQFVTAIADYFRAETTPQITAIALSLIAVEIFSLPFLLRLKLSPLARFCSAWITFLAPFFLAALCMTGLYSSAFLLINIGFIVWGGISFWALDGPKAVHLGRVK